MKTFIVMLLLPFVSYALTCPPAHQVERKAQSIYSKIEYQGLSYAVDKTRFDDAPYYLSKTTFIEAELSGVIDALKGNTLICAYSTFSQSNRKWGDILIKARFDLITANPHRWFLDSDIYSCVSSDVKNCSFRLSN